MSDGTKIEWAANADGTPGATWNPLRARRRADGKVGWFCVHASDGCRNCYAERLNVERFGNGLAYKKQNEAEVEIFLDQKTLLQPLRWKKPRTIFVCSMSDLFGEFVADSFIDRVMTIAACAPHHTFIVLTKRAQRMRSYFEEVFQSGVAPRGFRCPAWPALLNRVEQAWIAEIGLAEYRDEVRPLLERGLRTLRSGPLPNVWLGVSAERQQEWDARIPDLLATPSAIRFVSCEPLLGPIDLSIVARTLTNGHARPLDGRFNTVDWVIVGGESGPDARPMCLAWARIARDQCAAAGVPFFFKQWGAFQPRKVFEQWDTLVRAEDGFYGAPSEVRGLDVYPMQRVGKAAAGRELDGRTHDDRPPIKTGAAA